MRTGHVFAPHSAGPQSAPEDTVNALLLDLIDRLEGQSPAYAQQQSIWPEGTANPPPYGPPRKHVRQPRPPVPPPSGDGSSGGDAGADTTSPLPPSAGGDDAQTAVNDMLRGLVEQLEAEANNTITASLQQQHEFDQLRDRAPPAPEEPEVAPPASQAPTYDLTEPTPTEAEIAREEALRAAAFTEEMERDPYTTPGLANRTAKDAIVEAIDRELRGLPEPSSPFGPSARSMAQNDPNFDDAAPSPAPNTFAGMTPSGIAGLAASLGAPDVGWEPAPTTPTTLAPSISPEDFVPEMSRLSSWASPSIAPSPPEIDVAFERDPVLGAMMDRSAIAAMMDALEREEQQYGAHLTGSPDPVARSGPSFAAQIAEGMKNAPNSPEMRAARFSTPQFNAYANYIDPEVPNFEPIAPEMAAGKARAERARELAREDLARARSFGETPPVDPSIARQAEITPELGPHGPLSGMTAPPGLRAAIEGFTPEDYAPKDVSFLDVAPPTPSSPFGPDVAFAAPPSAAAAEEVDEFGFTPQERATLVGELRGILSGMTQDIASLNKSQQGVLDPIREENIGARVDRAMAPARAQPLGIDLYGPLGMISHQPMRDVTTISPKGFSRSLEPIGPETTYSASGLTPDDIDTSYFGGGIAGFADGFDVGGFNAVDLGGFLGTGFGIGGSLGWGADPFGDALGGGISGLDALGLDGRGAFGRGGFDLGDDTESESTESNNAAADAADAAADAASGGGDRGGGDGGGYSSGGFGFGDDPGGYDSGGWGGWGGGYDSSDPDNSY